MRVEIDRTGRLTIPKAIRDKAGLVPGTPLKFWIEDGVVMIAPDYPPVRLEQRGRFLVAMSPEGTPPMTLEQSNRLIDEMRLERDRNNFGPMGHLLTDG
jgi:AbrB family looped-hinge helix DNA binding protein